MACEALENVVPPHIDICFVMIQEKDFLVMKSVLSCQVIILILLLLDSV